MKRNKENISRMQVEVWQMKEKIYEETKGMNSGQFFSYIKDKGKRFMLGRKGHAPLFIR